MNNSEDTIKSVTPILHSSCNNATDYINRQYSYLTQELTNAMWGWYNIKLEDYAHE